MTTISVMSDPERRQIVGWLLEEVGRLRMSGQQDAAKRLDAIALRVEHPELADRVATRPREYARQA